MLTILLCSSYCFAQAVPPNRPEPPPRPERPVIERQAERQLERVARQLDRVADNTPAAAAKGLARAQQHIDRALLDAQSRAMQLEQQHGNRRVVADNSGQPLFVEVEVEQGWRAIEQEWLMLLSADELELITTQFPAVLQYQIEQQQLPTLQLTLVKLKVPELLNSHGALQQLLPASLASVLDRNHLYQQQTADISPEQTTEQAAGLKPDFACALPIKVGMIDSAIDLSHPVFSANTLSIIEQFFIDPTLPFSREHGTAVASRLLNLRPQTITANTAATKKSTQSLQLFAAAAFYQAEQSSNGALMAMLQAFEWLSAKQVRVINMSLTGPDNAVLQRAIKQLQHRGLTLVAAAGNGGPTAAPLFPAAYPGVIAVTAVDKQHQVFRWANRGDYIDFAAKGVEVLVAQPGSAFARQSGTSLAAPVVSALLACELANADGDSRLARTALIQQAKDLGEPGKDALFGHGLLAF